MNAENQKPLVVVIDDEESIRYTFETFLSDDGYKVISADNLTKGAELIVSLRPDLVFTDILLGSENGLEILNTVSEIELTSPVIVITGQPTIDTASAALRLGAYDYMMKPIVKKDLLRVSRNAFNNKQLMDEKERIRRVKDHYRNHLEAIFSNVDDPILSIDNSKRVMACNDAAYRIYRDNDPAPVQQIKEANSEFTPLNGILITESKNSFFQACVASVEKSLTNQKVIKHEKTIFFSPTGQQNLISINCSPLLDKNSQLLGAAIVVRDLTRIHFLEKQLKETNQFKRIIGCSVKMDRIFGLIKAVANTDATVLITGESGTGKSLVAREIHEMSERSTNAMVTVRCSALAEELLESELFGHVKGAFTGAIANKVGRFELCNNGSIFLDEIGEISPALQLKLLAVLQDREFEKVGDSKPIKINTRVIAATNRVLKEEVKSGKFREDLYYRLNVVEIKMPSLRERIGDIPLLVEHFLKKFRKKYNKVITSVSVDVMDIFSGYHWPGNVRELEHAIEHGFVLCRKDIIDVEHIPEETRLTLGDQSLIATEGPRTEVEEKEELVLALEKTDWNKAKTARLLGVSRPTLYRKLQKYDLDQA